MEVMPGTVVLDIYTDETRAISTGSPTGAQIFLGSDGDTDNGDAGSAYRGRQEDGKLHIWLEKRRLTDPERRVPYLAHEIARMLLMESPQPQDDPRLAEMTTMMFGLGVFNANASFYSARNGYILQREWGYALALCSVSPSTVHPPSV